MSPDLDCDSREVDLKIHASIEEQISILVMTQVAGTVGSHVVDLIKYTLRQIGAMDIPCTDVWPGDNNLASFPLLTSAFVLEDMDLTVGFGFADRQWTVLFDDFLSDADGLVATVASVGP